MALRTSLVAQPHLYMGDTTGRPLDGGRVYFGEPNKDPELYPINVFYDEALTIPAVQPVRTKGGFIYANGNMVEVFAAETRYSVKAIDSYNRQIFYKQDMQSINDVSNELDSVVDLNSLIGALDGNMVFVKGLQGGTFVYDSTKSAINDGGLVFNGWVRQLSERKITGSMFGAINDGVTDNTAAFNKLEESLKDGDTIVLSDGDYLGSFVTKKSINFIVEGNARIIQPNDLCAIKVYKDWIDASVVQTDLKVGTNSCTLVGAADIEKGSLITLWNGYMRDPSNPVNFETLLVETVTTTGGNTIITFSEPMKSYQVGDITAEVCKIPHRNITIDVQGSIVNNTEHWQRCVELNGVYGVNVKAIETYGTKGAALGIIQCFDIKVADDASFNDAYSVVGGAGYGLTFLKSSKASVGDISGRAMRHDFDVSSSYSINVNSVTSVNPRSSPVAVSHNGFTGDVTVGTVRVTISKYQAGDFLYAVNASNQGFAGDLIKAAKHPLRNIVVGDVTIDVTDKSITTADSIRAVSIECDYTDINIGNLIVNLAGNTAITSVDNNSIALLLQGTGNSASIKSIKTNKIGQVINTRSSVSQSIRPKIYIGDITVGDCNRLWTNRGCDIFVNSINYDSVLRGTAVETLDNSDLGGVNPQIAVINFISQRGGAVTVNPFVSPTLYVAMKISYAGAPLGSGVVLTDGASITMKDILLRNGYLPLAAPPAATAANISVSLPNPQLYSGQELTLVNSLHSDSTRANININATNTSTSISIASGSSVRIISSAGKWRVI